MGERSITGDSVVRVRVPSPGLFIPTHPDLDLYAGYLRTGEQDIRVRMKPGVVGVFLSDGESIGCVVPLKEVGG